MRYYQWDEIVMGGLIAVVVALIPLLIYATVQERKEWDAFAARHDCKVVGKSQGSVSTGVGPAIGGNGAGVAITTHSTPGQTAYLCDDGVTYWRNN